MVASAPQRRWRSHNRPTPKSLITSPFTAKKVSSKPAAAAANRTAPAVPSGWGSTA